MTSILKVIKVPDLISGLFIILFTYTAVNKLKDYATFGIALRQSAILQPYAEFLTITVPVVELIAVILLVSSITRKAGLFFSWVLMTMFTFYISYLVLFARELPCTCGGVMRILSWKTHLIVNFILLILATWGLFTIKNYKNTIAIDRSSRTPA